MAIEITEQIQVFKKAALEPRSNVGTVAQRNAIPLNERYNGMTVVVRTEGIRYEILYDGDFEALSETAQNTFLASNGNWAVQANGLSAYEVWLEEGNIGTKQDFIDSLKGNSFTVDAQGLLSARGTYDAELNGFSYLATDTGNLYIKNSDTSGDWSAPIPFRGPQGQSAYQVWIDAGNTGNVQDYIDSLKGDQGISAYDVAVSNGFIGTEAAWLLSLKGADGDTAYQVWLSAGNTGTVQDYLDSLKGDDGIGQDGASAYAIAVANGYADTEAAWLLTLKGAQGLSAYEVALANGFIGTEPQWLSSLQGDGDALTAQEVADLYHTVAEEFSIQEKDKLADQSGINTGNETSESVANKYEAYANVRRFTTELKTKVDSIITVGDGTAVLFNDGTYKLYRGLPDPATHAGKYLKTNGTIVSYESIAIGDIVDLSDILANKEDVLNKNVAGGYVGIDPVTGKMDAAFLPDTASTYDYLGTWDASTGNPPSLTPNADQYWLVTVSGTTSLNGINDWNEGDWAIYNGTAWEQRKNVNQFTDINGQTSGSVTINDNTIDHAPTGTIPSWIAGIYTAGKAKIRPVLNSITSQIGTMKTKLDGIEDNATADQTSQEIRDALQSLTGEERLDQSAIKNLNVGLLVLDNNITYTVGTGGNFATLNEALGVASIYKPTYDSINQVSYSITIRLLTGFVLQERITLEYGDWAFVKITSKNNDVIEDVVYDAQGQVGALFSFTSCVPPDLSDLSVIMDRIGVNDQINAIGVNCTSTVNINWNYTKFNQFRINIKLLGVGSANFSYCNFNDAYAYLLTSAGIWAESSIAYFKYCNTNNSTVSNPTAYRSYGIRIFRNSQVELVFHNSTNHPENVYSQSVEVAAYCRIQGGDFRINTTVNNNKDIVATVGCVLFIMPDVLGGIGERSGLDVISASANKITNQYLIIDQRVPTPLAGNLPLGGTTGQVLKKTTNTDGDADWANETGGGGVSSHELLSNLQGGQTGQYFHLNSAKYAIANAAEVAFTNSIRSEITANNAKISNVDREELEYTSLVFASSITITIPANIKHVKRNLTLTGNVTTLAFSGLKNGDRGTIYVTQDATGGRTIAKPAGHYGQFIIDDAPNEISELQFEYNGNFIIWRSCPVGDGTQNGFNYTLPLTLA